MKTPTVPEGLRGHELDKWIAKEQARRDIRFWLSVAAIAFLGIVALIWLWLLATPRYNLYKKNTEKRAVIAEQRAKSEAAEFAARSKVIQATAKGEARVIDAKAIAESQRIIAATLTPEYLRYLYIEAISDNQNQVIYVPTESGLPITEAGRATPSEVQGD